MGSDVLENAAKTCIEDKDHTHCNGKCKSTLSRKYYNGRGVAFSVSRLGIIPYTVVRYLASGACVTLDSGVHSGLKLLRP